MTALFNANVGQTIRLRFAEVDNQLFFNFGVDAVSLQAVAVPAPAGVVLAGLGLVGILGARRFRRKGATA